MQVPFYGNTDDGTHCFQAVFRMILKYYWPEKDFSWQELEEITAKVDGLWTWPTAGMLWLHNNGFEVHDVETFNYTKFIEKSGDYLIDWFGEKVGQEQIDHCNLDQEIEYAKQIVKSGLCETRTPKAFELKERLDEKYLLICNVNSRVLNGKEGYAGHFVLLTGYIHDGFILHDPGLPSLQNREVALPDFERAWAYPNGQAKNYIAIRARSN
jgi:hypothetical protein